MKLYSVKLEIFGQYYVVAKNAEQAVKKLREHLKDKDSKINNYELQSVELISTEVVS